MPSEPLPWQRKDYFKDHRKHDAIGGSRGGSSSSAPRWKEPYHGHRDFPRASPRRPPPGHYRQGGLYHPVYSEDSGGHGCTPSRSDRLWAEDDSCKSSSSLRYGGGRSGGGRDVRSSFQRSPLWGSGEFSRQHHEPHVTGPRSVAVPISSASQPPLKDQNDKIGSVINDGLATGRRFYHRDRSSWKPSMKWSRHSSSSSAKGEKSDTTDRLEVSVSLGKETPVRSPVTSPLPSKDDGPPEKKPRLGWGQGLARYEKQKVEDPSNISGSGVTRVLNNNTIKVSVLPEPVSAAIPCSATCSSSLEGKPGIQLPDDIPIKLDHLGTNSATALTSLLSDLLQPDDVYSADLTFTKYSSLNKLLMLKEDISKELEKTECEIDLSENELKALGCDAGNHLNIVTVSSMSLGTHEEHSNESNDSSKLGHINIESMTDIESMKVSHYCGNSNKESDIPVRNVIKVHQQAFLPEVIQSASFVKDISDACFKRLDKFSIPLKAESSRVIEAQQISRSDCKDRQLTASDNEEVIRSEGHNNNTNETMRTNTSTYAGSDVIVSVTAANKYAFTEASGAPINTLQTNAGSDIWDSVNFLSCRENDLNIREKLVFHKRRANFKEKILTFKFRVLHHLWKEDLRLLSLLRKHRPKSNKRFELGGRSLQGGSEKHLSSIKTSTVLPGNTSLIPTTEIVNFSNTLLSSSCIKPYGSNLKMPALILEERFYSRFVTHNALVEDPLSLEKEKSVINPWSQEEKEIVMEMLVKYGKDFTKISSYLQHKTTADCIEFYYKNHKSEMFREVRERLDLRKRQQRLPASTYLVTSGKKWNLEANGASVDLSGASSVVASQNHVSAKSEENFTGKTIYGVYHDWKVSCGSRNGLDLTNSIEDMGHERESIGMCGALSSEAVSSCVTNSSGPAGKLNLMMVDASNKAESLQHFDEDICSDEGFIELRSNDWSDEEKSIFIQALSAYGKDFAIISSYVKSRSREQCKIFYSKARKCLGLDLILHDPDINVPLNDKHEGRSDTDDACGTEIDSAVCSIQSRSKLDESVSHAFINTNNEVITHSDNKLPSPEAVGTIIQDLVGEVKLDIENKIDSEQVIISHHGKAVDEQNCSCYSISSKGNSENILPCEETKAEYDAAVYGDQEIKMECNSDVKTTKIEYTQGIYIAQTKDISLNPPFNDVKMEVYSKPLSVAQKEEFMNKHRANIDSSETTGSLHGVTVDSNMNNVDRSSQITFMPNYQHQMQMEVDSKPLSVAQKEEFMNTHRANIDFSETTGSLHGVTVDSNMDNLDRSSQFTFMPNYQHQMQQDPLHCLPVKAKNFSVKQEAAHSMPFNSLFPDQSFISFVSKLNESPQSSMNFEEHNGARHHNVARRDPYKQYIDRIQTANQVHGQLHIHRTSPLQMLNHEIEREADQICKKPVLLETYSRRKGGSHSHMSFLSDMGGHKGGISSIPSSRSGKQCPSKNDSSQSESHLRSCVQKSSADSEEHKSVDVKLFGTILCQASSSSSKSNSSAPENNKKSLSPVPNGSSFISSSTAGGSTHGLGNGRNREGLEDHRFVTYGFWDGNRIQTGFTSMPEAATLFSRYQGTLHGSYYSANDDIPSCNRDLRDYQQSCMQHLTSDGNQFESFSNIQKNGIKMVSGFWQHQGKVTRTDRVGGLIVGSGEVSDPVAALKLHYAAPQAKVLNSEIDSWTNRWQVAEFTDIRRKINTTRLAHPEAS